MTVSTACQESTEHWLWLIDWPRPSRKTREMTIGRQLRPRSGCSRCSSSENSEYWRKFQECFSFAGLLLKRHNVYIIKRRFYVTLNLMSDCWAFISLFSTSHVHCLSIVMFIICCLSHFDRTKLRTFTVFHFNKIFIYQHYYLNNKRRNKHSLSKIQ